MSIHPTLNENLHTGFPLISLITVVYNGEEYLESTIKSVLEQSYPNLHYIVIDGGSTDGTVNILEKYNSYIKHWISEGDQGIYDAMNKGWELCEDNSFILYLGAGDKILSLPSQDELTDKNTAIYGNVLIGEDSLFKAKMSNLIKIKTVVHHQSFMINKSLFKELPFDTKYKVCGDHDLMARLWNKGIRFSFSDNLLSYALPGGISAKPEVVFKEMKMLILSNFGVLWLVLLYLYYFSFKLKINMMLKKVLPSQANVTNINKNISG
jgi:glycosyltransferase involved in cell wall biosynthesis